MVVKSNIAAIEAQYGERAIKDIKISNDLIDLDVDRFENLSNVIV